VLLGAKQIKLKKVNTIYPATVFGVVSNIKIQGKGEQVSDQYWTIKAKYSHNYYH